MPKRTSGNELCLEDLWVRGLSYALTHRRFKARWETLPEDDQQAKEDLWGGTESGAWSFKEWLAHCIARRDFEDSCCLGFTHVVRVRAAPEEDATKAIGFLQMFDDYIVLDETPTFAKVHQLQGGLTGYVRKRYLCDQPKLDVPRNPAAWSTEVAFDIPSLSNYPLPRSLERLLRLRVQLISMRKMWTSGHAFKREVFKEGRMVNYGAKIGCEILPETCAAPFHPFTEHVLRLLNYPLVGEEPWRKISVVWNKYRPGDGTMKHKNWAGFERHMYVHFGDGSCRFGFFTSEGEELQARRVRSQILFLGTAANVRYLHNICDIRGGEHYSMAVRTATSDWEEWASFKKLCGGDLTLDDVPDLKMGSDRPEDKKKKKKSKRKRAEDEAGIERRTRRRLNEEDDESSTDAGEDALLIEMAHTKLEAEPADVC
ncbi:hypothetical protein DIPPA_00679 [Diplonema papillatum]|nr:hypothetical protein DIPPA_00679 [Diplonema papillatum]|eukprot:gene3700-5756_t